MQIKATQMDRHNSSETYLRTIIHFLIYARIFKNTFIFAIVVCLCVDIKHTHIHVQDILSQN